MTARISRTLRIVPAILMLAACADRSPVGGGADPIAAGPRPTVELACRVSVAARTVQCASPAPSTGGARGLIAGGQGQFVKLASTGVAYDSTTAILRADVTVQNLMPQPLGTYDGTTAAPEGVRVFFHSGPIVTSGTGTVAVANPDGTDVFTAGSQEYFQYDGILHTEQTSAAKEWRFSVPSTVAFFEFTVLVSAPSPNGSGYVTVTPQHPSIRAGATRQLAAVVRSGSGTPQDAPVEWSSSDTSVAIVSAAGVVTGVGAGTATITVTSGGRAGSTAVTVGSGEGDDIPPTLAGFRFLDDSVDVTAKADSAVVELTIDDDGSMISTMSVLMRSPSKSTLGFTTGCELVSGTETAGTWRCWVHFPRGGEPGTWTVEQVWVEDVSNHFRQYPAEELRAAGWPYTVQVSSSGTDTEGPVLTGFTIDPDSVDVSDAADTVRLTVSASDASDITAVFAVFRSPGGGVVAGTSCTLESGTARAGTWGCDLHVARNTEAGIWQVENIQLQDEVLHTTFVENAAVAAAGYEHTLRVTSTPSDNSAPLLTGFSFAPDTAHVAAAQDTVVVTIRATDDVTGTQILGVTLRSASGSTTLGTTGCELVEGTRNDGTFQCNLPVPQGVERGTYTFVRVTLQDGVNRFRAYETEALQAAGYALTFVVDD
ncbi:MAG TPA: Ig-like domain-containing protein [Longimicrobium sp.]|nr:Ig-like domain-containing protein [Longimicrobium sp.]